MSVPVRLWFKKHSDAIYISHLDMNRTMTRIIRRAQIPIWYTEGFNRHVYITFPSPLPLFAAGEREPMDFKLEGDMSLDEIKQRMNEACPNGIDIVDVTLPEMKAANIENADYTVKLRFENMDGIQSAELLQKAKDADSLTVMKKTKKGQKEIDLKPYLTNISINAAEDGAIFTGTLPCGNTLNINPFLIMDAICNKYDLKIDEYDVTRNRLLDKNLNPFK